MKRLVDILSVELKRWPDSLGDAVGQASDGTLHNDMEPLNAEIVRTREKYTMCKNYIMDCVTRAEWQAAVDALNAPKVFEWDGVGDPPVGVVCQYSVLNGPWHTCEVGYSFFDGEHRCFVIKCQHLGFEQVCRIEPGSEGSVEFRPVRTVEQVAAEEREKAIEEMVAVSPLLDKGWSRKVCAALYDNDYRKQVAK